MLACFQLNVYERSAAIIVTKNGPENADRGCRLGIAGTAAR